ncbi:hypothetical protein N7478_000418 [Penicillium angulare]|uniref:uncharacterized protein n=1 Tax=Penicillium angulare TaxID=116970 RepID=UPI00253FBE21|nr:uncharacterized protein N7478_000418 [Penicillium angulare]KAJ5291167.1 hypothetical protein N7478_000418 [Penicillium angulare]
MASVASPKNTPLGVAPPTTHEALVSFSQNFSRAMPGRKSTKTLEDGMPPAPPPSPVAFAVDSNGKAPLSKREKIPSLSLE